MKSRLKRLRRLKPPLLNVARSMGKWKPQDDFLLIQSIMQLNDLSEVKKLTNFSQNFSLNELKDRWNAILYDAPISRMIYKNIKKLHIDDVLRLKQLAPFSDLENKLLLNLETSCQNEEFLEKFLAKNRISFHESRTVLSLQKHLELLKKLNLLKDQTNNLIKEKKTYEISFNELEDRLDDENIDTNLKLDSQVEKDMKESYDDLLHQIKRAEADIYLWQVLVDKATGNKNVFIEMDTLALLFNEKLQFQMKKRQIIIGRSSDNSNVDIDLFQFNLNKKISRKQCSISLIDQDTFILTNHGSFIVFVDGQPVLKDNKQRINDKSLIEIDDFSFLFLINYNILRT